MKIRVSYLSETEVLIETDHVSICVAYGRTVKCRHGLKEYRIGSRLKIVKLRETGRVTLPIHVTGKLLDIVLTVIALLMKREYYIKRGQIFTILSQLLNIKYVTHSDIFNMLQYVEHVTVTVIGVSSRDVKLRVQLLKPIQVPSEIDVGSCINGELSHSEWVNIRRIHLSTFLEKCGLCRHKLLQYVDTIIHMVSRWNYYARSRLAIYYTCNSIILSIHGFNIFRRVDPEIKVLTYDGDMVCMLYDGWDIYKLSGTRVTKVDNYESWINNLLHMLPMLAQYVDIVKLLRGEWQLKTIHRYLTFIQ